ncbi:MAG: hypothetical protein ABIA04_13560 [Pseudomonadota bacterium]
MLASTSSRSAAHSIGIGNMDNIATSRIARSSVPVEKVMANAALDEADRLASAAAHIGKKRLSQKQSAALIASHQVGADEGGSVFRYTQKQLQEKYRILTDGDFTHKEAREKT